MQIEIEIAVERTIKLRPEWIEACEKHVREQWELKPTDLVSEYDLVLAAQQLEFIQEIEGNWSTVYDAEWTVADSQDVYSKLAKAKKREQKRQK